MTLKQLADKPASKMTAKVLIPLLVGALGYFIHKEEPALCLDSPFSMRLLINGHTNDYEHLILTEDETLGKAQSGFKFLRLRQSFSAFQIDPVGIVVCQDLNKSNKGKILDGISLVTSASAADAVFTWNGHANDQRFKEWYDQKLGAMHRQYADNCELLYNLDHNGRSIPESFRWLARKH